MLVLFSGALIWNHATRHNDIASHTILMKGTLMMNSSWKFSSSPLLSLSGSCILFFLLEVTAVHGATYYVATNGSDSNPGSLNQAFKSFAKGVSKLQPGDTLYIRGGIYTEQIDLQTPNKTGTAGNYLTIAGYPGETVTIRHANTSVASYGSIKARGNRGYLKFENLVLDGADLGNKTSGMQLRDGNHHIILRNIEIKNHKGTALGITANNIEVVNCIFHDNISEVDQAGERHYGIYFREGSNVLIDSNKIYGNSGGGIQVYPGPASNSIIRNNEIHHNNNMTSSNNEGIIVMQNLGNTITNISVYNNLIYLNGVNQSGYAHSGGIRVTNGVSGTKIWNNTIYGNKGWGVAIESSNTINSLVQNNIVYGNSAGQITDAGTDSILSNNLSVDPKFIKPDSFDFRVQAYSPAIDGGIDLNEVLIDFRKVSRPKGTAHDIGAYEHDGSEKLSVSAPKDLLVQ